MHTPLDNSPEVLAHQAREMASSFGYPTKPADSAVSLDNRGGPARPPQATPAAAADGTSGWRPRRPSWPTIARASPRWLPILTAKSRQQSSRPPSRAWCTSLWMEPGGCASFRPIPIRTRKPLDAAGRARRRLPRRRPRHRHVHRNPADVRARRRRPSEVHSWKGPHPRIPGLNLTVDLASWKGRMTQVAVHFDWPEDDRAAAPAAGSLASRMRGIVLLCLAVIGLLAVVLLARRNWRLGHIDRKGALRIGIARCLLGIGRWIGTVHPVPDESMIPFFFANCAAWLMWGAALALLYVALEPLVRARWPHSIVTWSRLLAGRWLDAQVGSHILIGATVGAPSGLPPSGFGDWSIRRAWRPAAGSIPRWEPANGSPPLPTSWKASLFFGLRGLLLHLRTAPAGEKRRACRHPGRAAPDARQRRHLQLAPTGKLKPSRFNLVMYSVLVFVLLRLGLVATMAAVFFIDDTQPDHPGHGLEDLVCAGGSRHFPALAGHRYLRLLAFPRFARVVRAAARIPDGRQPDSRFRRRFALRRATTAPGPAGSLPITPEMLLTRPSGDLFGWSQNAGMGWDPRALGGKEILILSTHGGIRDAEGTPIALGYHTGHWEVGLLMEAAAARTESAGRHSLRGLLHRPLRRPHAGHHRHVRQPALPQRRRHRLPPPDPLAAHAPRRDRRGHLRQRAAGHDDGAGRHARSALRAGARRRDAAGRRGRRCRARANRRRALRARPDHARGSRRKPLPRLRHARRRLPVPGHRGHFAGGRRSAGHVAAALRAGAFRDIPSGSIWPAARPAPRSRWNPAA